MARREPGVYPRSLPDLFLVGSTRVYVDPGFAVGGNDVPRVTSPRGRCRLWPGLGDWPDRGAVIPGVSFFDIALS